MKSFNNALLVSLLAVASRTAAVFVDTSTVTGEKIYELRDAQNTSRKLGACDNDILCVISTGEEVMVTSTETNNLKNAFIFPQGIPSANSSTPAYASSFISPLSSIGEMVGGPQTRVAGPFTTKARTEANAVTVEASENGLSIVFKSSAGDHVGIQDDNDGAPAARVNDPFEWRLFEVQKPKIIMIDPIRPDGLTGDTSGKYACGGRNQKPCPSKAAGGPYRPSAGSGDAAEDEPIFTILPVAEPTITIQTIKPEDADPTMTIQTINPEGADPTMTIQTINPEAADATMTIQTINPEEDDPVFTILPVAEPTFTILPVGPVQPNSSEQDAQAQASPSASA